MKVEAIDRFLAKVEWSDHRHNDTRCIAWTASLDHGGYGRFWADGRVHRAHRWVYERMVGPIPDGLELDHLCRNRWCVNPRHLEPVTTAENLRRGVSPSAMASRKTHCVNGHEFTPENTREWTDRQGRVSRLCRTCRRINNARYRERLADLLTEMESM